MKETDTLEFPIANQEGNEIIIMIVTRSVCDSIWDLPLFLPWFNPMWLMQASSVPAPVGAQRGLVAGL